MDFSMTRRGSLLFIILCLAGMVSCSRKQDQVPAGGAPGQPPVTWETAPQPVLPSKPPVLQVYYEKEPVPPALLEAWPGHAELEVTQTRLVMGDNGKWPTDGDLYIASPRFFASLNAQVPMLEWPEQGLLEGVNPAFKGHGFDPQNKFTRPWRWTPYVFYIRRTADGKPGLVDIRDWVAEEQSLWPADWELLLGMRRRLDGKSANSIKTENEEQEIEALKEKLKDRTAAENECWNALQEGRIQRTFLPANLRLRQADEEIWKSVDCHIPARGTLTQFDHLMVAASSVHSAAAQGLVQFLIEPAQQSRLTAETGYFPVLSLVGHEMDQAQGKLPGGPAFAWFNLSEFLVGRVLMPPTPAAMPQPAEAGAVSPVLPAGK